MQYLLKADGGIYVRGTKKEEKKTTIKNLAFGTNDILYCTYNSANKKMKF